MNIFDFNLINTNLKNRKTSKTMILFFAGIIFLTTTFQSCKTCKCPAYSKTEYQNGQNVIDFAKNTGQNFYFKEIKES